MSQYIRPKTIIALLKSAMFCIRRSRSRKPLSITKSSIGTIVEEERLSWYDNGCYNTFSLSNKITCSFKVAAILYQLINSTLNCELWRNSSSASLENCARHNVRCRHQMPSIDVFGTLIFPALHQDRNSKIFQNAQQHIASFYPSFDFYMEHVRTMVELSSPLQIFGMTSAKSMHFMIDESWTYIKFLQSSVQVTFLQC